MDDDVPEVAATAATLHKADEIKTKLQDANLSANQRKKYRKRLSRLFHAVIRRFGSWTRAMQRRLSRRPQTHVP